MSQMLTTPKITPIPVASDNLAQTAVPMPQPPQNFASEPIGIKLQPSSEHAMNPDRQRYLSAVRTVVIKLGTQLLSTADGKLDTAFLGTMAAQIAALRSSGI